ncbi:MAG: hypothetical protein AAGI11_11750 [Pseudomonadota bacterium]
MNAFKGLRRLLTAVSIALLIVPPLAHAQYEAIDDKPNPYAMFGDLVVARPIGLLVTVAGTATWVVGLPFSLAAGNAEEAAEQLIMGPGKETFVRCLGCRQSGYTYKDIDNYRARQAAAEEAEAMVAAAE